MRARLFERFLNEADWVSSWKYLVTDVRFEFLSSERIEARYQVLLKQEENAVTIDGVQARFLSGQAVLFGQGDILPEELMALEVIPKWIPRYLKRYSVPPRYIVIGEVPSRYRECEARIILGFLKWRLENCS